MEFHQLRYFVAAAETGSITAAAAREHVTQPALSRQIGLLERRLGVDLFVREKQRIALSDAGRWFLPRARQILCDAATSAQQLRESFGKAKRTLRLGFLSPFLDDLVAPVVRALKKQHRGLHVALFDLAPRAQLDRLAAHELDAALLANLDAGHREQFVVKSLSRHRCAAVLPDTHPHATARSLPLAALRGDDWVSLSDHAFPGRREFLRAACATAGFEPRVVAELDSVHAMLGAVAAGDGVAIAPRHSAKLPHAGGVFVPLQEPVPMVELLLLSPRGAGVPELATLAQLLLAQARGLGDR
ncbi:MAG: LysR family transcriptional regulator [Planctomycetes bacterium]|nr:LysR family transcriptional regulator [Planctomycetota bacterium]